MERRVWEGLGLGVNTKPNPNAKMYPKHNLNHKTNPNPNTKMDPNHNWNPNLQLTQTQTQKQTLTQIIPLPLTLSQNLSLNPNWPQTWTRTRTLNQTWPSCHISFFFWNLLLHLCIYEDRYVHMQGLIFFLIFPTVTPLFLQQSLTSFLLSFVPFLSFPFILPCIAHTWSMHELSAHWWFSSLRSYQNQHSDWEILYPGSQKWYHEGLIYIHLLALIHLTWL